MRRLHLVCSSASHAKFKNYPLPKPFQSIALRGEVTGDDCSIATARYLGVADGVGQWNRREHGSAGLWSRLMITAFAERMDTRNKETCDGLAGHSIVELLEDSYHSIMAMCAHPTARPTGPAPKSDFTTTKFEYQGSTTFLCAALQYTQNETLMHIVNIGDSSLILVRDGVIIFESQEQQHWFDCPFQIGHHSPDTPKLSSSLTTIALLRGDIVVASTDGLGDNVYPAQILNVIADERQKSLHNGERSVDIASISQRLCGLAREKMADEWGESPFGDKAICEGIGFMGGKRDDVSILVGEVTAAT